MGRSVIVMIFAPANGAALLCDAVETENSLIANGAEVPFASCACVAVPGQGGEEKFADPPQVGHPAVFNV